MRLGAFFLLAAGAHAAQMYGSPCAGHTPPNAPIPLLQGDARYDPTSQMLTFTFMGTIFGNETLEDVNLETNKFTTLHMTVVGFRGTVHDKYLRFCDYVKVRNQSGPPPLIPGEGLSLLPFPDFGPPRASLPLNLTRPANLTGCPLYPGDFFEIDYELLLKGYTNKGPFTFSVSIIGAQATSPRLSCTSFIVGLPLSRGVTIAPVAAVLGLILITIATNIYVIQYSPYQESSNPFLFIASSICNGPLLDLLTPSYTDVVAYFQLVYFLAGLHLFYPNFFHPIMRQFSYALLSNIPFVGRTEPLAFDDVYSWHYQSGLNSIVAFTPLGGPVASYTWGNYILAVIVAIMAVLAIATIDYIRMARRDRAQASSNKRGSPPLVHQEKMPEGFERTTLIEADYSELTETGEPEGFEHLTLGELKRPKDILELETKRPAASGSEFKGQARRQSHNTANAFSRNQLSLFCALVFGAGIAFTYLIFMFPLCVWTLFQLAQYSQTDPFFPERQNASLGMTIAGILVGVVVLCHLMYLLYNIVRRRYRLYNSLTFMLLYGALYSRIRPTRIYFLAVTCVVSFLRAVVIATITNGLLQVIFLAILEVFSIVVVLSLNPYHLNTSLSTHLLVPLVCRVVDVLLCIAYLPQLNNTERTRTIVGFAHLGIHMLIFCYFLLQNVRVIYKTVRARRMGVTLLPENPPVVPFIARTPLRGSPLDQFSLSQAQGNTRYYRGDLLQEGVTLQSVPYAPVPSIENPFTTPSVLSPLIMNTEPTPLHPAKDTRFDHEYFPEVYRDPRVRDYTFREGDLKYRVDPEVQKLWDLRQKRTTEATYAFEQQQAMVRPHPPSVTENLRRWFKGSKPPAPERSFQVSRKKPSIGGPQLGAAPKVAQSETDPVGPLARLSEDDFDFSL